MSKERWAFVTAPFILFTVYTFLLSSSFPDAPERMRVLVSAFLGGIILLLILQVARRDKNYFVPTLALILAANFLLIFSLEIRQFGNPEQIGQVHRLLLERPQFILYFGLMMMALIPPFLWKGSFTRYFSQADYPDELWHTREFVLINRYLSFFWVVVFFLCFVSQFAPVLLVQLVAPMVIVLTIGAMGTKMLVPFFISKLGGEEE